MRPSASSVADIASTPRSMRAPASAHSTVASAIGTSGSASRPSVPDSGISTVSNAACQPTTAPNQCAALRATSQGSTAAISRNGARTAST